MIINLNLIDSSITSFQLYILRTTKQEESKSYKNPFCKAFIKYHKELSKNDWELHKRLACEGVNLSNNAKAIRSDNVKKIQEISSQNNFDFNQTIKPSLYEDVHSSTKEIFLSLIMPHSLN